MKRGSPGVEELPTSRCARLNGRGARSHTSILLFPNLMLQPEH